MKQQKKQKPRIALVATLAGPIIIATLIGMMEGCSPGTVERNRPTHSPDIEVAATTACRDKVRNQKGGDDVIFRDSLPAIHDEFGWVIEGTVEVNGQLYDYGCELHLSSGEWIFDDFMLDRHY